MAHDERTNCTNKQSNTLINLREQNYADETYGHGKQTTNNNYTNESNISENPWAHMGTTNKTYELNMKNARANINKLTRNATNTNNK